LIDDLNEVVDTNVAPVKKPPTPVAVQAKDRTKR